jgi:hypothetical protein
MAELAVISTVASIVSATHSASELTKKMKTSTLFAMDCDVRDYLNKALVFREESLKLMERYQEDLPHELVHKWRVKHSE